VRITSSASAARAYLRAATTTLGDLEVRWPSWHLAENLEPVALVH
jgi:hypothetical protein